MQKMEQLSFLSLANRKGLKKEKFLETMEQVIPWKEIISEIEPLYPQNPTGRKKTQLILLLKIHLLQNWYNLSDPGVEEEIYDRYTFQKFLGIDIVKDAVPDETTILNFRHFLEANKLQKRIFERVNNYLEKKELLMKSGTIVDATIIKAPSSTKNQDKKRDQDMSSTKKGNNYHFGMKYHIGTDMQSGLVHSLEITTAKESDKNMLEKLLHGEEKAIFGDKGYYDSNIKHEMREEGIYWGVLDKAVRGHSLSTSQKKKNKKKSSVRAKVEYVFRVVKCQFGYVKTRYKGLQKNGLQLYMLTTLANLNIAKDKLLQQRAECV